MTKTKTVLIWGREDVLSSSVEHYLATNQEWQVTTIPYEEGLAALLEAIKSNHPDVLILHQGDQAHPTRLPAKLIQDYPGLMIITINLMNNSMEVYTQRKVWIKEPADLLAVMDC